MYHMKMFQVANAIDVHVAEARQSLKDACNTAIGEGALGSEAAIRVYVQASSLRVYFATNLEYESRWWTCAG